MLLQNTKTTELFYDSEIFPPLFYILTKFPTLVPGNVVLVSFRDLTLAIATSHIERIKHPSSKCPLKDLNPLSTIEICK